MYRHFKNAGQTEVSQQSIPEGETQAPEPDADADIVQQVTDVWQKVLSICSESADNGQTVHTAENSAATSSKFGGWQTVRIFVSSTFIDFFSEREVLVKKVFPELREWCQERRVKLVECDLRWGVPKDATSTQALLTCMEEIDRCYEANHRPFFLNMLGQRYGWIPGQEEVPTEVRSKYGWVEDSSMTFMEILYGALRISNPHAAFFMRDPGFLSQLPEDHAGRFKGESTLGTEHMKVLKSYLKEHYPHQVFTYAAEFGGLSATTGRELVTLTGLDSFAEQVKDFFKAAISKAYPQEVGSAELTAEEKERELQWLFIREQADTLIGRDTELQHLLSYARRAPDSGLEKIDGKESTMRKAEDWDTEEGDSLLCVVTAQGGWGKTALLAALVHQAKKEGLEVFHHFVGSTATSGSHDTLLHRLLLALAPQDDPELDPKTDTDTKKKHLRTLLASWRQTKRQILIVIDGVNELDNSGSLHHLSWLPTVLPPGVRCVVSANDAHLPTASRLLEHPALHLPLAALEPPALRHLAERFLLHYGKKLESGQLQQLVDVTKVDNPLWMMLMCEELRVFGDFRMMDEKLGALPDTMAAFLSTVIDRLLMEDETGYVKKTLFLMASSANGLPTNYILRILGDAESQTECPLLYWAQVRRALKPYSRTVLSAQDGTEYFTFVHEAMWKAVRQSMETAQEGGRVWHRQLADFYQHRCDSAVLRVNYLPRQLQLAGLDSRLIEFIRRDPHACHMPTFQKSRLLSGLRCRNPSSATVPGSKETMICQGCFHRRGGFNPGALHLNKDACFLCGSLVFQSPATRCPARMCSFHAMRVDGSPNMHKCCVCRMPVFVPAGGRDARKGSGNSASLVGPGPAQLCQQCGFGIGAQTCCLFKMNLSS